MKKITPSFFILFSIISLSAQEKLVVEYEMFTKMEMDNIQTFSDSDISDKEWQDALKEAMAKPSYYKLTLTPEESIYEYLERIDNNQKDEVGRVMISFGSKGNFYKNLKENLSLRESNSWDVDYLINDTIKIYDWKITKESQEILGYETRKATAVVDSTKTVVAWYAPKLAFKNGPDSFGGLPGLILKTDYTAKTQKGGSQTQSYTAISIKVADQKTKMTRPKKGKKVTSEQFKKENDELMKRMNEMHGDGVDKD